MRRILQCAGSFFVFSLVVLTQGCSGAQKDKSSHSLEDFERNSPPPADPCVGEKGAPLECAAQADCCQGYSCAKDPERNPARRYCLKE